VLVFSDLGDWRDWIDLHMRLAVGHLLVNALACVGNNLLDAIRSRQGGRPALGSKPPLSWIARSRPSASLNVTASEKVIFGYGKTIEPMPCVELVLTALLSAACPLFQPSAKVTPAPYSNPFK
jgi:hypothetical protein